RNATSERWRWSDLSCRSRGRPSTRCRTLVFIVRSSARERRRLLLEERVEAGAAVGRGEEPRLQLALEREAALERELRARLHGALDEPDGERRLPRRDELAREFVDARGEAVRLEDAAHEAEPLGLLEVERPPRHPQVERARR